MRSLLGGRPRTVGAAHEPPDILKGPEYLRRIMAGTVHLIACTEAEYKKKVTDFDGLKTIFYTIEAENTYLRRNLHLKSLLFTLFPFASFTQ